MIAYGHREPDAHILSTSMEKTFTDLGNDSAEFHFKRGMLKHDIFMVCFYNFLFVLILSKNILLR